MNRFRLLFLQILLLGLAACAGFGPSTPNGTLSPDTPDSDAASLVPMGEQALNVAQKVAKNLVLRQVDTDLFITDFRFVDSALTLEIMVVVPTPDSPVEKWENVVSTVSPLLTQAGPAIDLKTLRVGPNRVLRAVEDTWPGCSLRSLTLYRGNGSRLAGSAASAASAAAASGSDPLTWVIFCTTVKGIVTGKMDNQSGAFLPSGASPAPIPTTATVKP